MTTIRATVRIEITDGNGNATTVERTIVPTGFGDNPRFFADVARQAIAVADSEARTAIEATYGEAPHPAAVLIREES